uniref:Putative salivary kunitz domain protein n=1 Tax=Ixodes ricinus TaxID=34613 RepID=A0A0K8R6N6_IXORI
MLIQFVWILAIAAKGLCSTSCQSSTIVNVCHQDPDTGSGTKRLFFFYDWRTDNCIEKMVFPPDDDDNENKFVSQELCNTKCRRNVPKECFEDPENRWGNQHIERWTYNSSSLKCEKFSWKGGRGPRDNIFESYAACNNKCRIADLGLCAYRYRTQCKHGDDLYIWYNYEKQRCEILPPDYCPTHGNAFYTFRQCYQRCGRFVEDKCKLPIQNMSFCTQFEYRYGYNTKTEKCEKFWGCEDDGNNFHTAKACWETCTTEKLKHRCVQDPDYRFSGVVNKYYYDINSHSCISKYMFRGYVPGDSNIFHTQKDCEATCMATYQYEEDWL